MNTSKNTIGAAIAALHSNTPANVPNPFDKTGTVPKLTMAEKKEKDQETRYARQLIETYGYFDTLPVDRREGLVEISIACIEEAERRMEFRLQFQTGIVHLFPSAKAVTWETYKHAARFVRYTFGITLTRSSGRNSGRFARFTKSRCRRRVPVTVAVPRACRRPSTRRDSRGASRI